MPESDTYRAVASPKRPHLPIVTPEADSDLSREWTRDINDLRADLLSYWDGTAEAIDGGLVTVRQADTLMQGFETMRSLWEEMRKHLVNRHWSKLLDYRHSLYKEMVRHGPLLGFANPTWRWASSREKYGL